LAAATSAENKELIPVPKHPPTDPINVWLKPMTLLAARLAARHDNLSTWPAGEALQLLVEENVKAQVANVLNSSIIQNAWMNGQDISVHGWVFEIESGQLRDLKVTKGRG
jgi:carbonic anhydrase